MHTPLRDRKPLKERFLITDFSETLLYFARRWQTVGVMAQPGRVPLVGAMTQSVRLSANQSDPPTTVWPFPTTMGTNCTSVSRNCCRPCMLLAYTPTTGYGNHAIAPLVVGDINGALAMSMEVCSFTLFCIDQILPPTRKAAAFS